MHAGTRCEETNGYQGCYYLWTSHTDMSLLQTTQIQFGEVQKTCIQGNIMTMTFFFPLVTLRCLMALFYGFAGFIWYSFILTL